MVDSSTVYKHYRPREDMNQRQQWLIVLTVQSGLLGLELGGHYDAWERQIALALTNVFVTVGIWQLHRWLQRRQSGLSRMTIGLVLGSVWLDALGNFQHLYAAYWWYDRLTHAVGGLAVTGLFIDLALKYYDHGRWFQSWWPAAWFGLLLGQFVAAMYEISEWLGDWWFGTERVRGLFDTPRDLLFNLLGGLIVVGLLAFKKHQTKKPDRSRAGITS